MDPTLAALLGAALGVAATVGSTFVQTRRAREAWWREHRMKAYAEFLESIDRGFRASTDQSDDELDARGPAAEAMRVALARVELLGPPKVFAYALIALESTLVSIAHDAVIPDLEQDRFIGLQRFVRQSKLALGEPGIK